MNHLTLEQCQNLKEIGFPQDTVFIWYEPRYPEKKYVHHKSHYPHCDDRRADLACPTLEELLEWLTPQLKEEIELSTYPAGNWDACISHTNEGKGYTPLEAVYNLILALNP